MKRLPTEYVNARREYILFTNDCGVSDMARRGGIYEHYIFDYVKYNMDVTGTTIIDIGANFGFHTLEFAELVGPTGKVISFEPQKLVYYQLCGNIILNGYDNVTAHNVALGDVETVLRMENSDYQSPDTINIGNAHLNAYTDTRYNVVDVKRLDSYEFNNISVIKIDVQGYEPNILDGAIQTITKHRPVIFIEVELAQLQVYGYTESSIFDRLISLGYEFKKLIDKPHLVDYVAIPSREHV